MKKSTRILLYAIIASSAISCSKDPAAEPGKAIERVPSSIVVKAQRDAFNVTDGDMNKWISTDTLTVMDSIGRAVSMSTNNSGVVRADFSSNKWEGGKLTFGVCSGARDSALFLTEGSVRLAVAPRQYLDQPDRFGLNSLTCVGKVAGSPGSFIDTLYNITGLLKLEILRSDVATIVIKSPDGKQMSGWVDVDYNALKAGESEYMVPSPGMTSCDNITICGKKGTPACDTLGRIMTGIYYFAALPGDYAAGLEISIYDKDGNSLSDEPIVEKPFTLERNGIYTLKKLEILPSTIVLDIQFNNPDGINPLGFDGAPAPQGTAGEKYKFTYQVPGTVFTQDFDIVVNKGTVAGAEYKYYNTTLPYGSGYVLYFNKREGRITAPAVSGRYLQSATIYVGTAATGRILRIKHPDNLSASLAQRSVAVASGSGPGKTAINFYSDGNDGQTASMAANKTLMNNPYCLVLASSSNVNDHDYAIDRVVLVYMEELPSR